MLRGEWYAEVRDSMHAGEKTGQDSGVRSIRDRAVGESLREADSVSAEGIQSGSFDLLAAIAAHMVGAQGVDGYQEDVWRRFAGSRWRPGGVGKHSQDPENERQSETSGQPITGFWT